MVKKDLVQAITERRSVYSIGKSGIVSETEILKIVRTALQHSPTAFHSQGGRILLLFGEHHDRLWTDTLEMLEKMVPPERLDQTREKIKSFQNGYGTILFFEAQSTIHHLEENFPLYAQNFAGWSLQSSGMLQYGIWLMLDASGYGASLQHYNPLIDEKVKAKWEIPDEWKLIGEMPFGGRTGEPEAKNFLPLEERMKVYR